MAEDNSGGVGRLLGTNELQRSITQLTTTINQLGSTLRGQRGGAAPSGAAGGYTSGYNQQAGANTVGGNYTFGGKGGGGGPLGQIANALISSGQPQSQVRNRPNGGGGTFGGPSKGGWEDLVGQGGNFGGFGGGLGGGGGSSTPFAKLSPSTYYKSFVGLGNRLMPTQVMMDSYVTWATIGNNSPQARAAARIGAFGTNSNSLGYGLSAQDLSTGAAIRYRTFGDLQGVSGNGGQLTQGIFSLNATDPTLGAAGGASFMKNLYSTRSYYALQAMGLGRMMIRGRAQNLSTLANTLVQRTYGNRRLTNAQMAQGLTDNGYLGSNISNLSQQLGWTPDQTEAFKSYIQAKTSANNAGVSDSQYDQLVKELQSGSKLQQRTARRELQKIGISTPTIQNLKNSAATKTGQQADIMDSFNRSVQETTDSMDKLNKSLGNLLKIPIINQLVGMSGASSAVNTAMFDLKNGPLGPILGPIFGTLGKFKSVGGSVFGGAGEKLATMSAGNGMSQGAANNGTTPGAGSVGGVSAASVLAQAKKFDGWPYLWGGARPSDGGFDCSGLWDYAMRQAGYQPMPPNRMVVSDFYGLPGVSVRPSEVKPGDFVMVGNEHIEMFVGNGQTYGAHHSGTRIGARSMPAGYYDHARRVFGAGGSLSGASSGPGGNQSSLNVGSKGGNAGGYGSVEEVDALMAAFMGGGGTGSFGSGPSGGSNGSGKTQNIGGMGKGGTPSTNKALAKQLAAQFGWSSGSEWSNLLALWEQESSWNNLALNHSSGAFGIPQALGHGGSGTGGKYGNQYPSRAANDGDAGAQIQWGLGYIRDRYGDPNAAEAHERANNWYDKGAWEITQDQNARIHKGEMVIPPKQSQIIRDALLKDSLYASTTSSKSGRQQAGADTHLNFHQGSVVFNIQGAMTQEAARAAASAFAAQLAKENLYEKIATGVTAT